MKRKLSILLIALIFVAGIGIMSYPLVSSAINNYVSRSMVKEYTNRVAQMPSEKTQKMFEEAAKYNNSLSNNMIITDPFDEKAFQKIGANYEKTLNIDDNGLIGYIDVPKNQYLSANLSRHKRRDSFQGCRASSKYFPACRRYKHTFCNFCTFGLSG